MPNFFNCETKSLTNLLVSTSVLLPQEEQMNLYVLFLNTSLVLKVCSFLQSGLPQGKEILDFLLSIKERLSRNQD